MTNDYRSRRPAIAALCAAGLLWGTTVPLSKLALEWLPPAWLAFTRLGMAGLILVATAGRGKVRAAARPSVLAWGAAGYGAALLLQNAGIAATSVSEAALLMGAGPVLIAVIAAAWHRSVARPLAWAGYAVSAAGVALIAGGHGGHGSPAGSGLVLASLLVSAIFTVQQSRLLRGRDAVAVTGVQFLAAALVTLPVAMLTAGAPPAPAQAGLAMAVLMLTVAGTLLPFTLFAYGQARLPAHVAGAFINIEPLVGAAAGALFFGDVIGWPQLAGGAAILAGVGLATVPASRQARGQALPGARDRRSQPVSARLTVVSSVPRGVPARARGSGPRRRPRNAAHPPPPRRAA